MRIDVLGERPLDFTSTDGTEIKGTQIFAAFAEEGVIGKACDKFFVREGLELPALAPGMVLELSFNRKGRIEAVKAVSPK